MPDQLRCIAWYGPKFLPVLVACAYGISLSDDLIAVWRPSTRWKVVPSLLHSLLRGQTPENWLSMSSQPASRAIIDTLRELGDRGRLGKGVQAILPPGLHTPHCNKRTQKRILQPLPTAPSHRHPPWAATTFPRSVCTSMQPNSWSQRHWPHHLHGTAQSARSRLQPASSARSSSALRKPARNPPNSSAPSKSPTRRTGSDGNTSTTTLGSWRGPE